MLSYPKEPKDIVTLKHGKVEIDVEGIADNTGQKEHTKLENAHSGRPSSRWRNLSYR